jgi:hypothetical protein
MTKRFARWRAGLLARRLTAVTRRLHGGTWETTIDHDSGFVLILLKADDAGP